MGERVERRGITSPSKEEVEALTGKGAGEGLIPWIPGRWKKGIAAVLGITGVAGAGAVVWELTHLPAATTELSQEGPQLKLVPTYTPTPQAEAFFHSQPAAPGLEKEKTVEEFPVDKPSIEIPQEWQSLIGKEKEDRVKEPIIYTVKEGDTLIKIAREHNDIPWEIIYNMNREVIGDDSNLIKPSQELLIIHWGPAEASQDLIYRKMQETLERGEEITWVNFTLGRETTTQEVADFFGIDPKELAEFNEINNLTALLPKGYYLMIPIGEGFAFTETDREAGRRWLPKPGISLGAMWENPMRAIWWENPTAEAAAGPWYPNKAFMLEPYPKEYWIEAQWSSADELPPEEFVPEIVTDIPANRTWEITDEEGNVTYEAREGFLVYGKKRIIHTEYRKTEAGEWVVPEPTA